MRDDQFFCAAESRRHDEAIYGTVARIRSWLLLEYPNVWRRHAIDDSRLLSDAVKAHIRWLHDQGRADRSLLIRREHRRTGPLQSFIVLSCEDQPRISRALLRDYDELPDIQERYEPVEGLIFAACTHARHDKCCAKFGLPVYCALRDHVGDRAWQCSHVGGDRFAANVVVFPYGLYYGRVQPGDVPELVRLSELGHVWLPGYRGRSCYPRPVQAAEYFLRAESGRTAIDEFRLVATERSDSVTRVHFEARSDRTMHAVEFKTSTDALARRLTCEATELSSVPQHTLLRYLVSTS